MTTTGATTVDALIELVHHYYPAGVSADDPRYRDTEQAERLRWLLRATGCDAGEGPPVVTGLRSPPADALALGAPPHALQAWPTFIQALRAELPECEVSETTLAWPAPCYRCEVELPATADGRDAIVCLVSVLAPVYALLAWQGSPDVCAAPESPEALPGPLSDCIARVETIMASTLGFVRLSYDVLDTIIPDAMPEYSHCALGEATLWDCLFTPHRPRAWPGPSWIVPWTGSLHDLDIAPSEAAPLAQMDALIELVHHYYPAGVSADDPRYRDTEQAVRLRRLLEATARDMGDRTANTPAVPADVVALGAPLQALRAWPAFLEQLRGVLPRCTVSNLTVPRIDPCFKCAVTLPGASWQREGRHDMLVCLLSLLAPVYAVYTEHHDSSESRAVWGPLPDEFRGCARAVEAAVASVFGFARLCGQDLLTPVPDLVPENADAELGEATLLDCLFTPSHP